MDENNKSRLQRYSKALKEFAENRSYLVSPNRVFINPTDEVDIIGRDVFEVFVVLPDKLTPDHRIALVCIGRVAKMNRASNSKFSQNHYLWKGELYDRKYVLVRSMISDVLGDEANKPSKAVLSFEFE